MALESNYTSNGSTAIGGPQSYFELPPPSGTNTRDNVAAPPTAVVIDLSNPHPVRQLLRPDVQLDPLGQLARARRPTAISAPGRGRPGQPPAPASRSSPTTRSRSTTTTSATGRSSTPVAAGGSGNRLVLQLAPGDTLPADDYRVYMPNQVEPRGNDTRIFDIYGNQLDGEFLGNQTSQPSPSSSRSSPTSRCPSTKTCSPTARIAWTT